MLAFIILLIHVNRIFVYVCLHWKKIQALKTIFVFCSVSSVSAEFEKRG